ncbi:hypothetical protein E2C01_009015 [Portunus trituberculatus]|uniref:Uncharacterized protein n=1 Tax=Portunus trituberculatus TaxID=210409 RepID=A0A5B7D4C1_PORTR|nr:hypothetical protein [Portunus trituberculatus]
MQERAAEAKHESSSNSFTVSAIFLCSFFIFLSILLPHGMVFTVSIAPRPQPRRDNEPPGRISERHYGLSQGCVAPGEAMARLLSA